MDIAHVRYYETGGAGTLGAAASLTVITDTAETGSQWLCRALGTNQTVQVCFYRAPRAKKHAAATIIDLTRDLFAMPGDRFDGVSLKQLSREISRLKPSRVILEHPEIMVAAGLCSAAELLAFVLGLGQSLQVVVACHILPSLKSPKLEVTWELDHLVTSFLHNADLVLGLRPFPTGRAEDVTGVFRVSAGPRQLSGIAEAEYLFTVAGTTVTVQAR